MIEEKKINDFIIKLGECIAKGEDIPNDFIPLMLNIVTIYQTLTKFYKSFNTSTLLTNLIKEINNGNKISAIRWYREITGKGLKESKDDIEEIIPNVNFNICEKVIDLLTNIEKKDRKKIFEIYFLFCCV